VKAAVFKFLSLQLEVALSLFVHVKCGHPKFLWLWCIRELILCAGWAGHRTQPRGWQSMGRQSSSCAWGGWDNPYISLTPFCLSATLSSMIHLLCQLKPAQSSLPGPWGRGAGDTVALCCKYGKQGLSFVEAARRGPSSDYLHRHCIQSAR